MSDMNAVIIPKSDQISADDLIGGDMTIKIVRVSVSPGQDQPVSIHFEGSERVYRPCKSMARVMVEAWGANSATYAGRKLQLYRDPTVKWGGLEVGGIRIRAMSHIDRDMTMALTATKGSRKPFKVTVLREAPPEQPAATALNPAVQDEARKVARTGSNAFREWFKANPDKRPEANAIMAELKALADAADAAIDADPFGLPPVDPTPETLARAEAEAREYAERAAREEDAA